MKGKLKKKENMLFALYIGDLKEGMLTLSHVGRITISVGSNPMTNWNSQSLTSYDYDGRVIIMVTNTSNILAALEEKATGEYILDQD